MPKRKPFARRTKSGRAIPDRDAVDHGTPEVRALRARVLGRLAGVMPLSADNPIDLLTARSLIEPNENEAARSYQRAHAMIYGASQARAAALGAPQGPSVGVRARIIAERFLHASNAIVSDLGRETQNAFHRYVIAEYCDRAIVALRHGRSIAELLDADRTRIARVRFALHQLAKLPPVIVSQRDLDLAELQEALERIAA